MNTPPRILAIAGSDSSGGAGIQADIKTVTMLGGYAMTAVTAVTAQNTQGVQAIAPLQGDMVQAQIASCLQDIGVDAIKIGMLHDDGIVQAVAETLADLATDTPVVLDPVMIATSGAALIAPETVRTMRNKLFPLATMLTPNLPELEWLAGRELRDTGSMEQAAAGLASEFDCDVLAKGGHTDDERIIDILVAADGTAERFDHMRLATRHTHGTGCTLSSAIATLIGHGQPLGHAIRLAREFVFRAIEHAPGFGEGNGPLGHQGVGNP